MKPNVSLRKNLGLVLGVLICAWSALLVSFLFYTRVAKVTVPLFILPIILIVSIRFGVSAGVLGSTLAALILAVFLFAPVGSPRVSNKAARSNLAWLVLGGLTISYLLGSTGGHHRHS